MAAETCGRSTSKKRGAKEFEEEEEEELEEEAPLTLALPRTLALSPPPEATDDAAARALLLPLCFFASVSLTAASLVAMRTALVS